MSLASPLTLAWRLSHEAGELVAVALLREHHLLSREGMLGRRA